MGFPEVLVPLVVLPLMCLVPIVIVLILSKSNQHKRELLSRERLAAIEKGVPMPLELPENRRHKNPLRSALITVGVGIGLTVFFASITPAHEQGPWGLGILIAMVGLGMLVHWFAGGKAEWQKQRELDEELQRAYIDRLKAGLPAPRAETSNAD
jgi:hypothetical protein